MNCLPLTLPVTLLSLLTVLPAQQKVHELFTIDQGGDSIGYSANSAANMGDLDGDGFDDVAVGAIYARSNPVSDGNVFVISGGKNTEIARIHGQHLGGRFGFRVKNLGDVDKDGVPDIGVGSPQAPRVNNRKGAGMVFIYSGKTRKLIYSIASSSTNSSAKFGAALVAMGDLDNDGHADFAVGAQEDNTYGLVHVYSGKTGSPLYVINPAVTISLFGAALASLTDIDGDKIADLAVLGAAVKISNQWVRSPISLYSGKSGKLIRRIIPTLTTSTSAIYILRASPDIDGDKKPEILIAFPKTVRSGLYYGEVHIYSSGTGKHLGTITPPVGAKRESFALDFDVLPDIDNDGSPEVVVGDFDYLSGMSSPGGVHIFSIKTGKLIETITTPAQKRSQFANSLYVGYLGDLNHDGNPEFFSQGTYSYPTRYVLQILSAHSLDLTNEKRSLSIYKGGKTVISIHAGLAHAKDLAMMIGSASGSFPGIKVGKDTLHLNPDAYLTFTLSAPHAVIFNNLSLLDANGEGKMGFTLPLGLPFSLAGTKLHHSCLFIGKAGLSFANTSVSLDITLF